MRIDFFIVVLAILSVTAGCGSPPQNTTVATVPETAPPPGMVPIHPTGKVAVPPGMAVGAEMKLTATPELDARIAKLEKQGNAKKELAAAYADRGFAHMTDSAASSHIKYRAALKDYHKALKSDPTNQKAKTNATLIEGIYRQMGIAIPAD